MTAGREGGEATITCDGRCRVTISQSDVEAETFQELVDALKDDGWLITQRHGQWCHFCPDDLAGAS